MSEVLDRALTTVIKQPRGQYNKSRHVEIAGCSDKMAKRKPPGQ